MPWWYHTSPSWRFHQVTDMGLAKFVIGKTYTTCGCLAISGPDSSIFRIRIRGSYPRPSNFAVDVDFCWVILKMVPSKKGDWFWMVKVYCLRWQRIARRNPALAWREKPISVIFSAKLPSAVVEVASSQGGSVWCLGAVCSFEATNVLQNCHLRVGCFYGNLRRQKARWETILPVKPLDPLDFVLNPQSFQTSIWFIQKIDSL